MAGTAGHIDTCENEYIDRAAFLLEIYERHELLRCDKGRLCLTVEKSPAGSVVQDAIARIFHRRAENGR